ncbi:MAG: hypothetical protein IIC67_02425 [Thaumarchaeota archaeon]|nr:hypothetical protein [Nitrososphaerota archaeon]
MSSRINATGLWIKKQPMQRIEKKNHWAELRIKFDKKTKSDYIDILFGNKDHDPHIHIGRKLDGEILFSQSRNELQSSQDIVDSALHGRLLDETMIFKGMPPKMPLEIKITYDSKTKEVKIKSFKLRI